MLCSKCNKNKAIIFINRIENGKSSMEGLCFNCAKAQGIDPNEVIAKQNEISNQNNPNVNAQIESVMKDLAKSLENIDLNNILVEEMNEDTDPAFTDPESKPIGGFAIPLGSIFGNMVNPKAAQNQDSNGAPNKNGKKVKDSKNKNSKTSNKKKFLDTFGTNLTVKAKNNQLDIIVGRDKEIQRITQILNRRSKNNPCLIGEPGVGKTAIAQGLAIKIANNNVPAKLLNKEVYLLDMTSMIAGTQFRGQFESRMKGIIDECKQYGNIILVIDEIHNIIGAGDGEHSMNAANILKPALSNGEVQLIGTTTLK